MLSVRSCRVLRPMLRREMAEVKGFRPTDKDIQCEKLILGQRLHCQDFRDCSVKKPYPRDGFACAHCSLSFIAHPDAADHSKMPRDSSASSPPRLSAMVVILSGSPSCFMRLRSKMPQNYACYVSGIT